MVSTNVESLSTPGFVDSGLLFIAFQIYPHPVDRQIVNNRNFPLQSGTPQMKYPNIPIGSEAKGPPVQSTTPITCLRGLVYLIAVRKGAVASCRSLAAHRPSTEAHGVRLVALHAYHHVRRLLPYQPEYKT